jgi:predicted Zn-dependent protease
MGSFEEAIAEFKCALDIDSLSLIANAALGYCHYFARRYDQAIEQWKRAIEMDRHSELAHVWLGWAYEEKGMWEEAIHELKRRLLCRVAAPGSLRHWELLSRSRERGSERKKCLKTWANWQSKGNYPSL